MNEKAGRRPGSTLPIALARALRRQATPQERRLWARLKLLREQGLHFRRQVPIDQYIVDFVCLRAGLIVEIDGGQHNIDDAADRDRGRDACLAKLGFRVLRFWNTDVATDINAVVDTILQPSKFGNTPPQPSPEGEGGVSRRIGSGGRHPQAARSA